MGSESATLEPPAEWPRWEWPEGNFSRVPYPVFFDPRVYGREQRRIFRGPVWSYLALEAEIPNPGDYLTTFAGDIPVVVSRDQEGGINAFVNRCAHRGAIVRRQARGNDTSHICVYHQWCYDLKGNLTGLPFRKGAKGRGGYDADFDVARHGLEKFRVERFKGCIFGTLSSEAPSLEDYLDEPLRAQIARIFQKPIRILGYARQDIHSNWKLYAENVRDPYHASLLHLFHTTFGLYRMTQTGGVVMDRARRHSALFARPGSDDAKDTAKAYEDVRAHNTGFSLNDPRLLQGKPDFGDGIGTTIISVFPNLIVQQIANTLATRQIRPKGVGRFELYWTYFGLADDDAETAEARLKAANLIGPAGLISMEDGVATVLVQDGAANADEAHSVIEMGGKGPIEDSDHLVTEVSIRGFWRYYHELMGFGGSPAARQAAE